MISGLVTDTAILPIPGEGTGLGAGACPISTLIVLPPASTLPSGLGMRTTRRWNSVMAVIVLSSQTPDTGSNFRGGIRFLFSNA